MTNPSEELVKQVVDFQTAFEQLVAEHAERLSSVARKEVPDYDKQALIGLVTTPVIAGLWAFVKAGFPKASIEARCRFFEVVLASALETAAGLDDTIDYDDMRARMN